MEKFETGWQVRVPPGPLRPFVGAYIGYRARHPPGIHRGLPSGRMTFIVSLTDAIDIVRQVDQRQRPARFACVLGGLHAVPAIIARSGLEEGNERVGWSRRHLGGRFELEFGLPPKTAARTIRFGRLIAHLRHSSGSGLAGAAAACGYYDQSHLTREFSSMAGCAPGAWIAEEFPSVQDAANADHDPGEVAIP